MEFSFASIKFILTVYTFHRFAASAAAADLSPSGNLSLYPGEDASFICSVNTLTSANVVFQWIIYSSDNGMNYSTTLSENNDTNNDNSIVGSGSSIAHYNTFNVTNVNYTNNGNGFQCNASGDTSVITYLTVLTPVILIIPKSPIILQAGNVINLTCMALGGPRLKLSWLKDDTVVASSLLGIDTLNFYLNSTTVCDCGNYTCIASIDDMQQFSSVLVVPNKISQGSSCNDHDASEHEQFYVTAMVTLTVLLVITISVLIISVVINFIQRRRSKKYDYTKRGTTHAEINLMAVSNDYKNDVKSEAKLYGNADKSSVGTEPVYEAVNKSGMSTEPEYEGVSTFITNSEPEYEPIAINNYKRQRKDAKPHSQIYTNTNNK